MDWRSNVQRCGLTFNKCRAELSRQHQPRRVVDIRVGLQPQPPQLMDLKPDRPVWSPAHNRAAASQMRGFMEFAAAHGAPLAAVDDSELLVGYEQLRAWSVEHPERFWPLVWRFCDVRSEEGVGAGGTPWDEVVTGLSTMEPPLEGHGAHWFPGARLNFAENLVKHAGSAEAIVSWDERGLRERVSGVELLSRVERFAAALRRAGVGIGDRVAGFMPNISEAVVAMLATARLGAIWSSCSPDFGVKGVLDRFGQIEPKVLICADGYRYAGKELDCMPRIREVAAAIESIQRVVVVPLLGASGGPMPDAPHGVWWADFLAEAADAGIVEWVRLPFDHPLYIMYSSGTTGMPKCMVHGAGGTLLQHLKELSLHTDVTRRDRVFYFTTCGWMMWNWLVSALATGATVVLYDGAPLPRARPAILWDMASEEGITVFGTSARYLALIEKEGLRPSQTHDLSALRTILSTGSPLAEHSFDYVYSSVHNDVCLASISGGTDIISCFALGNPVAPVYRGELQTRGLGMAVEIQDDDGRAVVREAGELVCTRPFPSMPVSFWNDPDGSAYRAAYFSWRPGVWRHGDWAELTERGGLIIHGRSDATLNPGGVRIGTAEIYRQVEQLEEVLESLVVGQDVEVDGSRDVRVVLFVRLADGVELDTALQDRIRRQVRENASPHHVPRVIVAVPDIPRTISGKITELAVRDVIHGRAVRNRDALANPGALDHFRDLAELAPGPARAGGSRAGSG